MRNRCRLYITPQTTPRERVLEKLGQLSDRYGSIAAMPEKDWGEFLNHLPSEEFIAFVAWYHENKNREAADAGAQK